MTRNRHHSPINQLWKTLNRALNRPWRVRTVDGEHSGKVLSASVVNNRTHVSLVLCTIMCMR